MSGSFPVPARLADTTSSQVFSEGEALLIRAEAFVWMGEYRAAIGILRKSLFQDPGSSHEANFARKKALGSLWDEIETHFWGGVSVQLHENCGKIEQSLIRERAKWGGHSLPRKMIAEVQRDEQRSHMQAYMLGQAKAFVGALCAGHHVLCESELVTLEELLVWRMST